MANEYTINEGVVTEDIPVEDIDSTTTGGDQGLEVAAPAAPPSPTAEELIAARDAEWSARQSALEARLASVSPFVEAYEKEQEERRNSAIANLVNRVVEVSDNSESPLQSQEVTAIRALVNEGVQMVQWRPWIEQNQTAANALLLAGQYLGRDATVGELQDLARELASYNDPRLMQSHIGMMKNNRSSNQVVARRTAATTRLASGVDAVTPAPVQSANATEFSILEQKIADDNASPAEWKRYEALYARARRGG